MLHWCPLRQPAHSVAACSPLEADTGSLGSYLQRGCTLFNMRCGLLLLWHLSFNGVIRHISLACQHVLVSTDLSTACGQSDKAKCSQVRCAPSGDCGASSRTISLHASSFVTFVLLRTFHSKARIHSRVGRCRTLTCSLASNCRLTAAPSRSLASEE